jgi:glucose-6-phosphate isomerase
MEQIENRYYRQSIGGCLEEASGGHGVSREAIGRELEKLQSSLPRLRAARDGGSLPLLRMVDERADLEEARAGLEKLSQGARRIVFFGTGGSGLGGRMLAEFASLSLPRPNAGNEPQIMFLDNLDGRSLDLLLANIDLGETRFVMISKSGGTPETLMQGLCAVTAAREAGLEEKIPRLFLGLTEPYADSGRKNGLRRLCEHFSIPLLEHHDGIGGRYSVLTNVGLLPAMALGLDAIAIRKGAAAIIGEMASCGGPEEFAPAVGAALALALDRERNIRNLVLMPYSDRLARFGAWYAQLWAESLGKQGRGSTPIAALGPVDQHSQLQLYLDGPRDHMITLMRIKGERNGPRLPADLAAIAMAEELSERTAGELVMAEQSAIGDALGEKGRPVRTIDMKRLNEETLGALIMHFMLETILAADLYGVNAFDQPAVELGKVLTRQYLARSRTRQQA